ncbi:hypothetical protein [Pelagimonas varians]|nr:hypothetical protein [Pelagimonas varians]
MFLAAFPLVLWLFQGSLLGIATALLQIGMFSIALRLISRGQEIHRSYNLAQVATPPRLPRKLMGSVLIGIVVVILAGHHFVSLALPVALGFAAMGLSIAAFGMDPRKAKGVDDPALINKLAAEHAWDNAEDTLCQITDRVSLLEDADLTRQAEAARSIVLRLMRTFGTQPQDVRRISKLVDKFTEIMRSEVDRLAAEWDGDNYLYARKRYVLKIDTLRQSFESHARAGSERSGRDSFDFEADLLLDRMPRESAA